MNYETLIPYWVYFRLITSLFVPELVLLLEKNVWLVFDVSALNFERK